MEEEAAGIVRSPLTYLDEPFAPCEDYNANGEAFVMILRDIAKVYTVRDLEEEFYLCSVYPMHVGWGDGTGGHKVKGGSPSLTSQSALD